MNEEAKTQYPKIAVVEAIRAEKFIACCHFYSESEVFDIADVPLHKFTHYYSCRIKFNPLSPKFVSCNVVEWRNKENKWEWMSSLVVGMCEIVSKSFRGFYVYDLRCRGICDGLRYILGLIAADPEWCDEEITMFVFSSHARRVYEEANGKITNIADVSNHYIPRCFQGRGDDCARECERKYRCFWSSENNSVSQDAWLTSLEYDRAYPIMDVLVEGTTDS